MATLARHKASLGRSLGKLARFSEAEHVFLEAIADLEQATDIESGAATAAMIDRWLAQCAIDLLEQPQEDVAELELALRMSEASHDLAQQYGYPPPPVVFFALALSQYRMQLYHKAISTCLEFTSQHRNAYTPYLILSASYANLGRVESACDWWLAAKHVWAGVVVYSQEGTAGLLRDVSTLLEPVIDDLDRGLSVVEQEALYSRLLERHPDLRAMRNYRGYCRFQLGRWREAKVDLDYLMRQGETSPYAVAGSHLLNLFYDQSSVNDLGILELRDMALSVSSPHGSTVLVVSAMLADRKGKHADHVLFEDVSNLHVGAGLVLLRSKRLNEAYGLLETHGGVFPARDALAEIILALIDWQRGNEIKARERLSRAEDVLGRLSPMENTARANVDVGYATSVIWLEPLLLLREAREMIPRGPDETPRAIDASLYPQP